MKNPTTQLAALKENAVKGIMPDCIFFWDGFMSQWHLSPSIINNVTYRTAEHYMMAKKAECFNDEKSLKSILLIESPRAAKQIGREVLNYDDKIWCEQRYQIVVEGNIQKFTQNPILQNKLIKTGNKVIVEASPYDCIWGVGLEENDPLIHNPLNWRGQNFLGFALMEVRELIK